jgi:hypothetical protein
LGDLPSATGGIVDFDGVFAAFGVEPEARDRLAKAEGLLKNLPAGTDCTSSCAPGSARSPSTSAICSRSIAAVSASASSAAQPIDHIDRRRPWLAGGRPRIEPVAIREPPMSA